MNWIEIAGYTASILVFTTFYMKTMIPLRCVALASNIAFITYGFLGHLYPILFLHLVLFPLNIYRLHQMMNLIKKVKQANKGDFSLDVLIPYMKKIKFNQGDLLFRKGDIATKLYLVGEGTIRLVEIQKTVTKGDLIGEMGVFSPYKERTATALCQTNGEIYVVSEEKIFQLYYQNPAFGFYLMQLIIKRFLKNTK
jgi:CRP/FNR family transcriptional regulator, cyclic AMP receptor protein